MKILFVTPYDNFTGGVAMWASHIWKHYQDVETKNVEMDLLPANRSSDPSLFTGITRVYWGLKDHQRIIQSILQCVSEKEYDIVHLASSASLGLFKDRYLLKSLAKRKIKTVLHFHFGRIPDLHKQKNWEWKLLKQCVALSSMTIVLDKKSHDVLAAAGFDNIRIVPNPIADSVLDFVEKNPLQRKDNTVFFAGHCVQRKGVYELVKACVGIPNVRLKMAGTISDNIKSDLLQLAGEMSIDLAGAESHEQVLHDMMSSNVFVLPTYTEGFPNVILEAMACGCPIVSTEVGAIPEMLEPTDGENCGVVVKARDVKALRDAIASVLLNSEEALRMGNNARRRVQQRYSMQCVWSQMVEVWDKALS